MADILNGDGEHKSFAPLSTKQTQQICQHLQSLLNALDGKVNTLRENLNHTDSKVDGLQAALGRTDSTVASMKETVEETSSSVEHLEQESRQLNTGVSFIHRGLDQTTDSVNALRDGLKFANTNADIFKEDMDKMKITMKHFAKQLGEDDKGVIYLLQQEDALLKSALNKLSEEYAATKATVQQDKEFLQSTCKELNETQEFLGRTDNAVRTLEEKLQQARHDLKTSRTTLEETNAVVIKIHDDHESMKAGMKGFSQGLHEQKVRSNKIELNLQKAGQDITNIQGELAKTGAKLDASSKVLASTADHVKSLREGFQMHSSGLADVQSHVEHVGIMALNAKMQIQETTSLLLPNLQLESDNPASQGWATTMSMASMGASTAARDMSMMSPSISQSEGTQPGRSTSRSKRDSKKTPRVKHTNAWLLRNIGTSPDRMAMI